MVAAFDTLKASRRLREAGIPEQQSDAFVDTFAEMAAGLATKGDIKQLEQRLIIRLGAMVAGATAILIAAYAVFG